MWCYFRRAQLITRHTIVATIVWMRRRIFSQPSNSIALRQMRRTRHHHTLHRGDNAVIYCLYRDCAALELSLPATAPKCGNLVWPTLYTLVLSCAGTGGGKE